MQIINHEKAGKLILHLYIIFDSPKIVTQVQKSGGPDTAHDNRLISDHRTAKIREWPLKQHQK